MKMSTEAIMLYARNGHLHPARTRLTFSPAQVAGGAYTMNTPAAATVRSSIRRLREIAEA
jgi:hypothetical protein